MKFTKEEQEQFQIDEDGYEINGYDRLIRCSWCGDIDSETEFKHEHHLGWLCDNCFRYLLSCGEKLLIDYNYEEDEEEENK